MKHIKTFESFLNEAKVEELTPEMQDILDDMKDKYSAEDYDLDVKKQEVFFVDGVGREIKGSRIKVSEIKSFENFITQTGDTNESIKADTTYIFKAIKKFNSGNRKAVDLYNLADSIANHLYDGKYGYTETITDFLMDWFDDDDKILTDPELVKELFVRLQNFTKSYNRHWGVEL